MAAEGLELDDKDLRNAIDSVLRRAPSRSQQILRRASFRIARYIGKYFDESGPPPGVKSTSPRLVVRTGQLFRGTVPGEAGTVSEFQVTSVEALWNYGLDLNRYDAGYPLLHEEADSFNVPFPERKFFGPGTTDFAKAESPEIEREIGLSIEQLWKGGA